MPSVLLAGTIERVTCNPFPLDGLPCCAVMIRVPESEGLWCVQAHDDMMAVAETLTIGDAVIQGKLQIAAPGGRRIISIMVTATQFLPLRHRSPNKLPVRREEQELPAGDGG
jgi:hypothetical protein